MACLARSAWQSRHTGTGLEQWADVEFQRFFETYDDVAKKRPLAFAGEPGTTNVYPDSIAGWVPRTLIAQFCIYVNRFFVHGPLLDLHDEFLSPYGFNGVLRAPKKEDRIGHSRSRMATVLADLAAI